ncbi:hypothetical protein EJD97_023617 [Solanum chilense]|uniref:Gag-pol polyprotein n=1 Tax=Solanum chilense TaxID=4083 RepID=A0A6N2C2G1_SOLCI|nr:hypothetical protein EJD97_023617 [Solanum chilense]
MRRFTLKLLKTLKVLLKGSMSIVEIRSVIHSLTQVLATQVSIDARVQVNPNANTTISRIRAFIRINSPTFYGSKVEEEPLGFIDEVFKVFDAMGVSSQETAELAANQLKDVAQVWSSMLIPRIDISHSIHAKKFRSKSFSKLSKVSTSKTQEGKGGGSYVEKPLCSKCGKHDGKCLVGKGNCYGYGNSGHMKRYFPMINTQGREYSQAQASDSNLDAPKKNNFCALSS